MKVNRVELQRVGWKIFGDEVLEKLGGLGFWELG